MPPTDGKFRDDDPGVVVVRQQMSSPSSRLSIAAARQEPLPNIPITG